MNLLKDAELTPVSCRFGAHIPADIALFPMDKKEGISRTSEGTTDEQPHIFLVKRNLRRKLPDRWYEIVQAMGNCSTPRKGKALNSGVPTASHPTGAHSKNTGKIYT